MSRALKILLNDALTSLSGLETLASVTGNLEIFGNNALTSLSGLETLASVNGSLEIRSGTKALTRLTRSREPGECQR